MFRLILTLMGLVLALGSDALSGAARLAAHIPLQGTLDEFLVESLHRRLREAKRLLPPPGKEKEAPPPRAAELIVFELRTKPGSLAAAVGAAEAVHKLHDEGVATVALIAGPGSGSDALLALACEQFFMMSGSALGPIDPAAFQGAAPAEARKQLGEALDVLSAWRTRLQPVYQAFLDPALEVHMVVYEGQGRTPKFVLADEYRRLAASPPSPILRSERVAKAGEPLKLSAADAERVLLSGGTAKSADTLAAQLGMSLAALVSLNQEEGGAPAEKAGVSATAEPVPPKRRIQPGPGKKVVFIPLDGMVGEGMLHAVERRLDMARKLHPALVVFEMHTPGGRLDSALKIADTIFTLTDFPSVAYVNREAISAGALISISCSDIVMNEGSVIGDSAVVDGSSGEMLRSEKIDSYLRARFRSFCEGKYPLALAEAMVTLGTEVYELETVDGQLEYLTGKDYENLLRSPEWLARFKAPRSAQKVVGPTELLTMTDSKAKHFGFSRATVKGRQGVLDLYGIGDREMITFEWNWSEKLARWLDFVGPVLLGLGLLAIMLEFKMGGTGVFAIIGVALIAVFFLSKYVAGLAEIWEILLFFVGLVMLAVEVFVTPGFGILGVAGLLLMMVSVLLSLQGFAVPSTPGEMGDFRGSVEQLGLTALVVFVGAVLIGRYLHRAPYLGKMILAGPPPSTAPTAVTQGVSPAPSLQEEERRAKALVGRRGRALSTLRPAGRADFDGEPLDVVTEGDLIEAGAPIEIAAVHGNRIVVQRPS